jgi:hypothetical protein
MLQFFILCDGLLGNRMDYSETSSSMLMIGLVHCELVATLMALRVMT